MPPSGSDLIVLDCFPFRALHNFFLNISISSMRIHMVYFVIFPHRLTPPRSQPSPVPYLLNLVHFFLIHQLQLVLLIFSWMCDLALGCGQHNGEHTHKEHRLFFFSSYCSSSMGRTSYPHPFPTPGILSKLPQASCSLSQLL